MIYWTTRTIGSSMRFYTVDSAPTEELVSVPASVLVTREPELPVPRESWLRRAYPGLTRLTTVDEGGHFLALEAPGRFVAEVREAFRPYR